MSKIAKYLNQHVTGNVYAGKEILEKYSTDKSILNIRPQTVAMPENTEDIRKLVKFAYQMTEKGVKLSVTPRGGGNDKTGAAIGDSMVVSMERMNGILEIDPRQKLVRVQPGVTMETLNSALALHGLKLPVEPICGKHTVGGMIANNLLGKMSPKYGRFFDYISQMELILSNGDVLQTNRLSKRELGHKKGLRSLEGDIYRRLDSLIDDRKEVLDELISEDSLDNFGYESISLVKNKDGAFDLMPIFFASQGTLGVVSEVILKADFVEEKIDYLWAEFESYDQARDLIDFSMPLEPVVLDIFTAGLLEVAENMGRMLKIVDRKNGKPPKAGLLIGFGDQNKKTRTRKLKKIVKFMGSGKGEFGLSSDENLGEFEKLRNIVMIYLNDDSDGVRMPVFDSAYVPFNFLGEYLSQVGALAKNCMMKLDVYGSVLTGVYNVRPGFDLANLGDRQKVFKMLGAYSEIIRSVEGSITGDGAEGRVKAVMTQKYVDDRLADTYKHVKEIFDPKNVMNPGVKTDAVLADLVTRLRKDYDEGVIVE